MCGTSCLGATTVVHEFGVNETFSFLSFFDRDRIKAIVLMLNDRLMDRLSVWLHRLKQT